MKSFRNQKGFTLIELVVMIVIVALLSVAAIPEFVNMQTDAQAGANVAWVGGLRSCLAMNFAGERLGKTLTPSATTATGPALPATGDTVGEINGCITGSSMPGSLTAPGTGTTWTGVAPLIAGGVPTSVTWTLTAGAAVGDPTFVSCSTPTTHNC
ncbi:MAG: prepilin-type N-terminal cleavage/methylation domain-containing protein [Nitrospiria bacterium]